MIDKILEKIGIKFEDLSVDEKDTLYKWIDDLEKNKLTIEGIRGYIASMKASVENELTKIGHESKQDIFLKARLRNYMLLEDFLSKPKKAKQAIEKALAGIINKKR